MEVENLVIKYYLNRKWDKILRSEEQYLGAFLLDNVRQQDLPLPQEPKNQVIHVHLLAHQLKLARLEVDSQNLLTELVAIL